MKRIRVSRLAEQDLDEIWLRTARTSGNTEIADGIVASIVETFRLFARTPEAGARREDIAPGVRGFPIGKFIVYYRVNGKHVVISRVIHGMRDQRNAYSSED